MKAASLCFLFAAVIAVVGKKTEEALNRDTTPFWFRDRVDGECTLQKIETYENSIGSYYTAAGTLLLRVLLSALREPAVGVRSTTAV